MAVQEHDPVAGRGEVPDGVPAAPDRSAVPGLIALLAATGFVLARWALWSRRSFGRFILIGENFAHPAQLPAGLPLRAAYGYDGQFYYRLAINPFNFSHTAYGITVDQPYRFMRVGYPMLTWLFSAGQGMLVPVMLVVVNVVALGALGWLGGRIARPGGRHAAWGLLLPGYFGLVTSLSRDTAEPAAAAFMVAGLLAVRSRRPALAAGLLAFAVLTRETAMVAVAALAVVRVAGLIRRRSKPGRDDLAWFVPAAVFAAWQVLVYAVIGVFPLTADGGRNAGTPFFAAFDAIGYNLGHVDWSSYDGVARWLAELAVLLLFAVAALCSLRTTRAPAHERLALVLFLVEICVITPSTWSSRTADLRSFVEVYLMAVIILLGRPGRARTPGAWLLPAVTAGLLPVLASIVLLRVHWS
ncbi:MAG: hypothetical protein ABSB59_41520 [Streptosporangiaceae bacterium]|jgi:hypothetical protein